MYRVGFIIEYSIGHVTFAKMLQRVVQADPSVEADWFLIGPTTKLWPAAMFPFSRNYSLAVSASARRMVGRARPFDVLFLHTQTLSLFLRGVMRRVPAVISADATPANIDEAWPWHQKGNRHVEAVKRRLVSTALRRATYVMPWSEWCARSLVDDYGVAPGRARTVRPGVDVEAWGAGRRESGGPLRVLFVGGIFERKGGPDLLAALKGLEVDWECDIVTKSEVAGGERVRVHRDLDQADPRLRSLFAAADVFVLPTGGDAMPFAILEAMAAGLPVLSTRVGAVPEVVVDGATGILVRPGDVAALTEALQRLVAQPELRREMGAAGRRRAGELFDEKVNGPRVLELLKAAADEKAGERQPA
jgi:glycosyltransferase involved in cell wall biosynthesis